MPKPSDLIGKSGAGAIGGAKSGSSPFTRPANSAEQKEDHSVTAHKPDKKAGHAAKPAQAGGGTSPTSVRPKV